MSTEPTDPKDLPDFANFMLPESPMPSPAFCAPGPFPHGIKQVEVNTVGLVHSLRRPSRVRPLTEEERDIADAERLMNDPAQTPVDYEQARRDIMGQP